ncbi:Peptidyl-tRNA hydrolase protein 2, mitochondrial, partial [Coelomomyces lativittatus]
MRESEPSSSSSVSTRKPQKMVFVVRTDLGMGKGKIASQCCHACLAAYEQATTMIPKAVRAWKLQGQTK